MKRWRGRFFGKWIVAAWFIGVWVVVVAAEPPRWVPEADYRPVGPELTVTFLDVGQGDAAFVQTPGGKTALIDGGGTPSWSTLEYEPGRQKVMPFLREKRVNRLDHVVISHPHGDHIAGLLAVFEEMKVGTLIDPALEHDEPEYPRLLELAKRQGTQYGVVGEGDILAWDPALRVELFAPPRDFSFDHLNNNSVVLKISYKDVAFLFPGDLEEEAERWMIRHHKKELEADVLKVGHHGSQTSSSPRFLEAVSPQAGVISCGRGNLFRHPHPDVLARFRSSQIHIFRTDLDGDITVRTDGRHFMVKPALHSRAR